MTSVSTPAAVLERTVARKDVALGVSAVICTRNRPLQLARALRSLSEQTTAPTEIIVVNNAPEIADTKRVVDEFRGVRYVVERRAGLDFARNRALLTVTQPVVAFLDDDAVADTGWCEAFIARFQQDSKLGACMGRVEAFSLEHPGQRLVEDNGGYSRGAQLIRLPQDARTPLHGWRVPLIAWAISLGSGCSMAVRRDAAMAVGSFDEKLGTARIPGGDDHDMIWRLLAGSYTVCYDPAVLSWHDHRQSVDSAFRQIIGHQKGLVAFLTKALFHGSLAQRAGVALFLVWRLIKPGARLLRRWLGKDPLPTRVLLSMWRNCWGGLIAYSVTRITRPMA